MIGIDRNRFFEEVEIFAYENDVEYIDAVIYWCEKNNIELELAAEWIKKDHSFKGKIQIEAENLSFLKKGARLPL